MEHKFTAPPPGVQITDGHSIAGYASVFGLRDKGGDTVQRGAYAASLARLAARGEKVRMLWQHDPAQPIGIWDDVHEDAHGLFVKGRILPELARGREALALITAGAIDGLSIGYRTVRAHKAGPGQRVLVELDLWEVSLVTFPMQADARLARKASDLDAATLHTLTARIQGARADLAGCCATHGGAGRS